MWSLVPDCHQVFVYLDGYLHICRIDNKNHITHLIKKKHAFRLRNHVFDGNEEHVGHAQKIHMHNIVCLICIKTTNILQTKNEMQTATTEPHIWNPKDHYDPS